MSEYVEDRREQDGLKSLTTWSGVQLHLTNSGIVTVVGLAVQGAFAFQEPLHAGLKAMAQGGLGRTPSERGRPAAGSCSYFLASARPMRNISLTVATK